MKFKMYSIADTVAETYSCPFYAPNDAVAKRIASDAAVDPASVLSQNPSDFVLYKIGSFDDALGIVEACPHDALCSFESLVSVKRAVPGVAVAPADPADYKDLVRLD